MIEASAESGFTKQLSYGMVGGGPGSFIGDVHRKSINLDGLARITAGCFSQSPEKTLETGKSLGLDNERLYKSYGEMAEAESKRPDKIDFVVIVTPNTSHYAIAKAFLSRGIPVVCDKPLCTEESEAKELAELAKQKKLPFMVTYTYTGNVTVRQMRAMIKKGEIGKILFVNAEYPQEWLLAPAEKQGNKQAVTRTDPALAGKANCVGDLGSHVENMVSYLTGLKIKKVLARLDSIGEGRVLDDNATIMLEYEGGAKGVYWTSQIAAGGDNPFRVRIFGSKGALDWNEENCNYIQVYPFGQPKFTLSRGRDAFAAQASSLSRIPSGHPEGYFESLANIYKVYINALIKLKAGQTPGGDDLDFPDVEMGAEGVKFIGKCVESSQKGSVWVNF
ncbi:MAG: Gfo/Idh/MocA family oxidoreductase [Treponema sp.]|jgi:predicted dehydrogenase|nr:Gfo/Idh/MocA family oxidoreductase [Treponema sp.]